SIDTMNSEQKLTNTRWKPAAVNQIFNLREKTRSFLRASELIREHSSDADLIVCTLPSARPEIPSPIYLGWIDMLSRQTPPTCLVRGNQVSMSALRLKFP
nr:hypothetical protein 3 - Caenorhabditis elegans [Caenorhabditis elegans]